MNIQDPFPRRLGDVINDEEYHWNYGVRVDAVKSRPAFVSAEITGEGSEIKIKSENGEMPTVESSFRPFTRKKFSEPIHSREI